MGATRKGPSTPEDRWTRTQRRRLVTLADEADATGDDLGSDEFIAIAGTGTSAIHSVLLRCIKRATEPAAALVLEMLNGGLGDMVADATWMAVWGGIVVGKESDSSTTVIEREPLATLALRSGNLDLLKRLVDAGPPGAASDIIRTYSKSQYLGVLCTCAANHSWVTGADDSMVFVSCRHEFNASPARELGLTYAMEMQPTHSDWDAYAAQPTEAGAHVRRFLMQHRIKESAPLAEDAWAARADPPQARRRLRAL